MDYRIWVLQERVYKTHARDTSDLKHRLSETWTNPLTNGEYGYKHAKDHHFKHLLYSQL